MIMHKEKIKKAIISYYKVNKRFPTIEYLMINTKLNMNTIKINLEELYKEKFLLKINNTYALNLANLKKASNSVTNMTIKKPPKKIVNSENMIRFIMFVISITAMYISIHYSFDWLSSFLDFFKASILAITMTMYTTFAFESVLLLWRVKTVFNIILGSVILVTSILALLFSMCMTVIGQYNKKIDTIYQERIEDKEANKNIAEQNLLEDKRLQILSDIEDVKKDIYLIQESLSKIEDVTIPEHRRLLRKLNPLHEKRDYMRKELEAIENELLNNMKSDDKEIVSIEKEENFYTWFSRLINNNNPGLIEFSLYLIPALFVDIMAPLGMLIALGFYKKEQKNEL